MTTEDGLDADVSVPRGVFRTADLPPGERNRAWNEIATQLLGGWLGSAVRLNSHSCARVGRMRPTRGCDHCFIQL